MDQNEQDQQPRGRGPARLLNQQYVRRLVAAELGIRIQDLDRAHPRDNGVLADPAAKVADEALAELLRDVSKELRGSA